MRTVKWLAMLPILGILVGVPLLNQVQPLILGLPLILAWIVFWIIATAAIMAIIYCADPANRPPAPSAGLNPAGQHHLGQHPLEQHPLEQRPPGQGS